MGAFASWLSTAAADALAWVVAPARCAACDEPCPRLAAFCAACASTVEPAPPGGPGAVAAFVYGGAVARAVARFKYGRRPDLARPLGDLLWRAVEPHAEHHAGCVVVPVPLHPARLAERGFNQSALLARAVSSRLGAPLLALALARTRDTPRQAALDRDARLANLAGALCVRQPARVRGRAVLLVDDVRTTGATTHACKHALLDAGARSVSWAVLARAL